MERTDAARKSTKRKPPVIRQTLASIYRIAKTNPLLFIDDVNINCGPSSVDLNRVKLPNSLKPITKQQLENSKAEYKANAVSNRYNTKTNSKDSLKPQEKLCKNNNTLLKRPTLVKTQPLNGKPVTGKPSSGLPNAMQTRPRAMNATILKKRRSLSADHYERKKNENSKQLSSTKSTSNLHKEDNPIVNYISPIIEERKVKFLTPIRSNKSSAAAFTPTPFIRKHSTPYATTAPKYNHLHDLQRRLKEWLGKHKKPVESYHHLSCFGLHGPKKAWDEEDKENVEQDSVISTSYENLKVETPIPKKTQPEDWRTIVNGCLGDLYKLILEGYCSEQSQAWLNVIREKYCYLENEPQYWECRAAIEQNTGNITSAVDCLRTAIVQGAEINSVDQCLEQLLQKFSLLDINTSAMLGASVAKKDRVRIVKDARNVFKSSIIQFAVQERTMKKQAMESDREKKYIATPVRRSTRLTPSRYRVTPKVQICSSLQNLEDGVRSNIDFHGNSVLNIRFSNVHDKLV